MIPDPEAVARAYGLIAPSLGLTPRVSEVAVRVALREADHLAEDVYDVPAALLFALGRHPRCFDGFRAMSVLVVEWHTKTLGFKLEATRLELADVLTKVALDELTHEDVKAWVVQRLLPFGG
jgi:prophage maintenance system killer protein